MWAGARATFGATRGKTCFEVRIDGNADTSHLVNEVTPLSRIDYPCYFSAFNENVFILFKEFPNVLRCGWSVDNASMQLGEEPLSFGYGGTAKAAVNCKFNSYGVTFGVGDVIGCFVVSYSTFIARRNVYLYIHFLLLGLHGESRPNQLHRQRPSPRSGLQGPPERAQGSSPLPSRPDQEPAFHHQLWPIPRPPG